ncbi:hypothetical protein V495_04091 [Pseudogymnoascus sp. VKM F-4514 (FW-929)]|nr:hypothetical protein V495_04091 [Pseudogymnoascus sp. VKM F-4514 (FW-929)]KFY64433.1 hypothetical protein V497_01719 [Pseudogymnoascus sp. VKM F-4516 (FW-969)]
MSPEDASDSRTPSVGRKRTLQQSVSNGAEVTARSPASDSDGSHISGRAIKRAKRNGSGNAENNPISPATDSASGAEANGNAPIEKPKDVTAAAMSWNKGVQATVRTSLGGSAKAAKKAAVDNKPAVAEKRTEDPANEVQTPIVADTSAPEVGEVSEEKTKRARMTRAQKRALSALEVATTKPAKPAKSNVPAKSDQKSMDSAASDAIKGKDLTLPSPSEKREREKPAGYITRDLRTNFVYELLIQNSKVLNRMDLDSIIAACDAYMNKHYSKIEKKYGAVQLKDESFLGFCRNRLKEAKAGTLSTPKPVSNASSVNGLNLGDISTTDSTASAVNGNSSAVEHSTLSNDRGQGEKQATIVSSVPETAEEGDDYSPVLEPMVLPLSGPTQETEQTLSEAEAALINKYYPGLPRGTVLCLTCSANGHTAASCPQLTCSTCGAYGVHFANSCPKTIRCSKCHQRGHQKPACPEKLALAESEGEACDICGSGHHTEQSCHFLWRSFKPDLGSVKKVRSLLADCYNCGADGHYGPECALSRSASLTSRYTWSTANRDRYVDAKMSMPANSNGRDYLPAKPQNGFSIKGSAKSNPVTLDDSDEEDFIRAKVPPPQPKSHIRFTGRQPLDEQYRSQPPPPSRYREPPLSNSYRGNDGNSRFGDDRPYSPPPAYPDYNQGRYDDQYHSFDHDRDYRSTGQPMMPFRGNNDEQRGGPSSSKRSKKGAGNGPPRFDNVAPPQSLAGKKSGRGGRGRGGSRGGGGRGGGNRVVALLGIELTIYSRTNGPKIVNYKTLPPEPHDAANMPETSIPPPPVVTRPSRPVSETLLNEKWDRCLSSLLIRSSLGLSFGVVFSVLIFKRRAWPAFVGLGFGAGRAYEECNSSFIRASKGPSRS